MERILVVDDEEGIVVLLRNFLQDAGFTVDGAHDGREALRLMREHLYSIVLCDIRLPDIDGKQLIPQFKGFNPLCNVVMITGYSSMDNVVGGMEVGAVDYFTKPFRDMDLLLKTVIALDLKIARWKISTVMVPR